LCFQSPDLSATNGPMKNSAAPPLMTLEELAQYLRLSKKTLYKLLRRGTITIHKIGSEVRFKKTEIDRWIAKQTVWKKK
jgi:excisionase family DNA binding protein